MSQELVDSVNKLTGETTKLLLEYTDSNTTLKNSAATAKAHASEAASSAHEAALSVDAAQAEVTNAKAEVINAKAEVTKAQAQVTAAATEANRAKTEADRATEVTGLDTVEAAVDMAMLAKNPYGAMTKAEYDALREQRKRENDGSGFKEWGKHYEGGVAEVINEGLYAWPTDVNTLHMGRGAESPSGDSRTNGPVAIVNGAELHIAGTAYSNYERYQQNNIKLPPAPDGTKTLNKITGEIRKYTNKAGIGVEHDAYTVDFNDSNYVQLPVYTLPVGSKISFKFNHSLSTNNDFIFDGDAADRGFIYISATSKTLKSAGLQIDALNGGIWSASTAIQDGVEYHLEATTTAEISISNIGANYTGWERFEGQIWDFKTKDADTGEVRHYPILMHDAVANGAPVTTEVRNIAEENPRDGYVVNYNADGYVVVPEFPLAAAMDISMTLRLEDDSKSCVFGKSEAGGHNLYFFHDQPNDRFQIAVGNWVGTHAALKAGRTYYIDVSIRQQAGDPTKYDITSTVNGDTQSGIGRTFLNTTFELFGLGGYGNGNVSGNRWLGQIYDFLIQYPDAPDMNRYYEGFDSNDPQGQLFVRDEYGFSLEDWAVGGDTSGYVGIPVITTGHQNHEVSFMFRLNSLRGDVTKLLATSKAPSNSEGANGYLGVQPDGELFCTFGGFNYTGLYIDINKDYYIKLISSGTTTELYIDGVLKLTSAQGYTASFRALMAGKFGGYLQGNLWDFRFEDNLNTANSRHYPLVINSTTQPTDDTPIVDEAYDKATAPFYVPAFSSVNNVSLTPWVPSTDVVIKFKIQPNQNDVLEHVLDNTGINSTKVVIYYIGDRLALGMRANSNAGITYFAGPELILNQVNDIELKLTNGVWTCVINGEASTTEANHVDFGICAISGSASSGYLRGRLWDIELIDNADSTNSRFYPGIVYSPDAVPTGTVFEQTLHPELANNADFSSGLAGWSSDLATDNGDGTVSVSNGGYVLQPVALVEGQTYRAEITVNELESNGLIRFDTDNVNTLTINSTGTTIFEFTAGNHANRRAQWISTGSSIVSRFSVVPVNDGTLTNFSAGSEWTLAQLDNLTEATAENFTDVVWTNDLPSTDAVMVDFTTPWVEFSTALHGEVVGNDTWVSSLMQSSQKAFDYASIEPDANVIISRKDLSFLEVWDEKISDKGILCPLGNTQYSGSPFLGISQYALTGYGVAQSYSAFGEWDKTTEGRVCKVANLTEEQLKTFYADPRNNVYWNPEDGEYYQTRYRVRTVEGLGDDWAIARPSQINLLKYGDFHVGRGYVFNQGASESSYDYDGKIYSGYLWYYGTHKIGRDKEGDVGMFVGHMDAPNNTSAILITLTQRMNQGAYHPTYNPNGSTKWRRLSVDNQTEATIEIWYQTEARNTSWGTVDVVSTEQCFRLFAHGITPSCYPAASNYGGTRSSGHSGRQDQYRYHDAIYAGQVEDLRVASKTQPLAEVLNTEVRKAVAGKVRGRGKVPFTTPYSDTAYVVLVDGVGSRVRVSSLAALNNTLVGFDPNTVSGIYINNQYYTKVSNTTSEFTVDRTIDTTGMTEGNASSGWKEFTGKTMLVTTELSSGYDSLPWVDIIGDPERIAATFPDGVVGQWIATPVGSAEYYGLNKKYNSSVAALSTDDDGASWTVDNSQIDTVNNRFFSGTQQTLPATRIYLIHYETLSDFTEPDSNGDVIGELGDVEWSQSHAIDYGNRLFSSLIDQIGVSNSNSFGRFGSNKLEQYSTYSDGELQAYGLAGAECKHSELNLAYPANESDAFKTLPHLVEKDGLLYMQWHATQLKHNGTDWGDDSVITIVDGESTKTDQNGNTVKVVTHTNMIPVGIAPKH